MKLILLWYTKEKRMIKLNPQNHYSLLTEFVHFCISHSDNMP